MAKVSYQKPPLSYVDQLNQLKRRGLQVENDAKALHVLEHISYYRLSGYWYPLIDLPKAAHIFKPGSTFDTAFSLYCFDRELRRLVIGELEKIEVAIRAKMIYELSHKYDSFWYTDQTLFRPKQHAGIILKIAQEYKRSDETFVIEFKRKYNNPMPPSWMMLEMTSFGTLSTIFKELAMGKDRVAIANHFGLEARTFESWLHSMVYVRNVCAHHARLWNREMRIQPAVPTKTAFTFLSHTLLDPATGKSHNNRTYYFLSLIIYFLNTINPGHRFKVKFRALLDKYPAVDTSAMGFITGWETEPLWS